MKIFTVVLGVLVVICGLYCLFTPIEAYSTLSWLIGLAMLVEGVGSIVTWNERRRYGFADGWTLVGAIVSVVLGLVLLCSFVAKFALDMFIAYMIAIWFIVGGIARILASVKLRDYERSSVGVGSAGPSWGLLLVMGVLVVILGVLCLFNPVSVMLGVGFMLGISITFIGVDLIVRGIHM